MCAYGVHEVVITGVAAVAGFRTGPALVIEGYGVTVTVHSIILPRLWPSFAGCQRAVGLAFQRGDEGRGAERAADRLRWADRRRVVRFERRECYGVTVTVVLR